MQNGIDEVRKSTRPRRSASGIDFPPGLAVSRRTQSAVVRPEPAAQSVGESIVRLAHIATAIHLEEQAARVRLDAAGTHEAGEMRERASAEPRI